MEELDLYQLADPKELASVIARIIKKNPDQVDDYLEGKESLLNWLFGQAMSASHGRAQPKVLRQLLTEHLKNLRNQRGKT